MDALFQHRHHGAAVNALLGRHLHLYDAGVKAHAVVVDKITVGPAGVGKAAVFVHPHQIVGADEVPSVDLRVLEERLSVQLVAAERAGGDIHGAGAHAVVRRVELPVGFILDAEILFRLREAEDIVLTARRNHQLRAAGLGHAVAAHDLMAVAVPAGELRILFQLLRRQVRAAAGQNAQGGEVDMLRIVAFQPLVEHKAGGEQQGQPVIAHSPDEFGVQETEERHHRRVA